MDPENPSYEEVRDTINRIMNIDTSGVLIDADQEPSQKDKTMADYEEGQDPKEDMAPAGPETEAPAKDSVSLAQIAEKVGMTEEELTAFLEQSGLLESVGGMEGLMAALTANPEMMEELAGLIKATQGGKSNAIPMV